MLFIVRLSGDGEDLVGRHTCAERIADGVEFVFRDVRAGFGAPVGGEKGVEEWFVHDEDICQVLEGEDVKVRMCWLEVNV